MNNVGREAASLLQRASLGEVAEDSRREKASGPMDVPGNLFVAENNRMAAVEEDVDGTLVQMTPLNKTWDRCQPEEDASRFTHVLRRPDGYPGDDGGFLHVRREEGRVATNGPEKGGDPFFFEERGSRARFQDWVDHSRNVRVSGQDPTERRDDLLRAEHADLDPGERHVLVERQILVSHRPGREWDDLPDLPSVLDGQGREDGRAVKTQGREDTDIEEDSCPSGRIVSGDREQCSFHEVHLP